MGVLWTLGSHSTRAVHFCVLESVRYQLLAVQLAWSSRVSSPQPNCQRGSTIDSSDSELIPPLPSFGIIHGGVDLDPEARMLGQPRFLDYTPCPEHVCHPHLCMAQQTLTSKLMFCDFKVSLDHSSISMLP